MSKYISVQIDQGFAWINMCREPVNSMNLEVWQELLAALDDLERNPKCRGLILQSTVKRPVFTAGNDLAELYAPKTTLERYSKFWSVSNTFLGRLLCSRLVTIAAIRGASPAVSLDFI
jgi:3,2-trans-enoyl-CoA isomerase